MIEYYKKNLKDKQIRKLKKFENDCWINAINPTKNEINYLIKTYKLDEQALSNGLKQNQIPRIEFINKKTYIVLNVLQENKKKFDTFLIITNGNFILTLARNKPNFLVKIIKNQIELITTQKTECLLKLFKSIDKDFEKSTMYVVNSINSKKRKLIKLKEDDINNLLKEEEIINSIVSSYYYTKRIYEQLSKKLPKKDKQKMENLIEDAKQGYELGTTSLKIIANMRNHFTMLQSNKLNKIITILTVFTILLSIPATIGGIYGMNMLLPGQRSPFMFYYILAIVAIIWLIFILFLKKAKIF